MSWHVVHGATGDPVPGTDGTEEAARGLAAELNLKSGRSWFSAREKAVPGDEAAAVLYAAWAAEKSPLALSWVLLDRAERDRWRRIASAAPRLRATAELRRFARDGQWLTCTDDGRLDLRDELLAAKRAVRGALAASRAASPWRPWERLWRS